MKKILVITAILCATAFGSNIYAQQEPPPGAGDKDLRDTNVKRRSMEMERIDREAQKTSPAAKAAAARTAVKFAEIKTDYEQIQLSQDAVIKTYQGKGKIDYAQIGKSALEINSSAIRLKSNLFAASPGENADGKKEKKNKGKTEKDARPTKSVRELIVDLDNTIGSFAMSPMFQNQRAPDAAVSEKARLDLEKIIEISAALNAEAQKMNAEK